MVCARPVDFSKPRSTGSGYGSALVIGDESHGLIVVGRGGIPMKYSNLTLYEQIVASQHSRIEVEVPGEGGK